MLIQLPNYTKKISRNEEITIGDALKLKELLNLTNVEAIDIFLS
jgi:hypothetical protein